MRALGASAALAAMLALWAAGGTGRASEALFDRWQRLGPADLSRIGVVVVAIDTASLRAVGPWPWSRAYLARLTDRIGAGGARAIGFDMVFPEADRQAPAAFAGLYPELDPAARAAVLRLPAFDAAFAAALGRHPTVLARGGIDEAAVDYGETTYDDPAQLPVDAVFARALPPGVAAWPQAIASIPAIEETALGHGLINGAPDPDGVVRRVPAVGLVAGVGNPGFAVELVRVARGLDGIEPIVAGGRLAAVGVGRTRIPVAPDGRFRLRFGALPPGTVISAVDVLRQGFDARRLRGKVAIVGLTGAGGTDVVATPIAAQAFGPAVQAQAVDAILARRFIVRPGWARVAETALGLALAGVAILLFPRLRRGWAYAVPPLLPIALLGASWTAYAGSGLLLDPLAPIAIGGAAAAAVLVAMFVETGRARRRLALALDAERLGAARAAGELEAARGIQRGMLAPPARLAGLAPGIDLHALLEPARDVGGDFYDAFALADGRIAFLVGDVTGKGVPAALFMALAKALARSAIERRPDDLGAAVALLARELARDNAEAMFVTLLAGIVDPATGALVLVNAGHEDPLRIGEGDGVEPLVLAGGPPVCAVDDFDYEAEPALLAAGEGLVIVTDGVTEAQDAAGTLIDRALLVEALAALPSGWRAAEATGALAARVRAFEAGAEPADDLTVLAVRRSNLSQS